MLYMWLQNITQFSYILYVKQKSATHSLSRSSTSCIHTLQYITSHLRIGLKNIHYLPLDNLFILDVFPINDYIVQNMKDIITCSNISLVTNRFTISFYIIDSWIVFAKLQRRVIIQLCCAESIGIYSYKF